MTGARIAAQREAERAQQALARLAEHAGPSVVAQAGLDSAAVQADAACAGHLETIAALEGQVCWLPM